MTVRSKANSLAAAEQIHAMLAGCGPDELTIPVNRKTQPALESMWREVERSFRIRARRKKPARGEK
jgi:hypothetical protein